MLPYTDYLDDCAASLASDPQHFSDSTLVYMTRSLYISQQTTYTFDHGSKEMIGELSDEKIQILVKALAKQMEEWRTSLPPGTFEIGRHCQFPCTCKKFNSPHIGTGRLQRAYYSNRGYLHEVGLYGLLQGQTPSVTRISILYECFNAIMKYLSCVIENSLDDMIDWTSLDWRSLNFGIMLSTKSSIILDSAYVSTEASQRANWLGKCLDTLCLRAEEIHRLKGDKCSYFQKLAHEWANIKTYHQNCIQRTLSSTSGQSVIHPQSEPPAEIQQQTNNVPFLDTAFDVDPFSELFWAGFGDSETGVTGIYQM